MNLLSVRPLDGEVLPPGATICVVGKTHPLSGGRVERELPAGLSIAEILEQAAGDAYRGGFIVHIDGHPILPENFARIRVKAGRTVTFMPRLSNGGGNIWQTVLSVVITVGALIAAPYLAPGLVSAFAGVGITVTATTAGALAAGGIMLAGMLALNALFPIRPPAAALTGAANSIQGAQNTANPWGPVPVVLGRNLQSPYYAAKPYTEISGDDQYVRMLFCLGYGPLEIDSLQIGQTPISTFQGVEIEVRQGFAGDPPITLYTSDVDEVDLSVTLDNPVDPPLVDGVGGLWTVQYTSLGTEVISLDFTSPNGISATDPQGNPMQWHVRINVQYCAVGSSAWVAAPDVYFPLGFLPGRLGLVIPVASGQYQVRARKATGNGIQPYAKDTVVWTAIRSMKAGSPVTFPQPLALVSLRILATNQLSGAISTFNCMTTSLVNAYSGSGSVWTANQPSQNPADLFRWVLQGPANARPVADAQIAITNLQDWWTYCNSNGFKFNQVVTSTGSVYDKLCDIASAGRAVPTFIDGQWAVVWDRPADPIVQHFTPRNSWGFQGQKPYAQQPNGWRVAFINEQIGYANDERIVYDDGYSELNATLFEAIQFPGVTDPALIWRHGRFQIAQARLRPEKTTLSTGWENLVCTRGDRVAVTHDVLLIGLNAGRVKSVAGQVVTFDETVTVVSGQTYGMSFRLAAQTSPIVLAVDPAPGGVALAAGEYNSLALIGDLSGVAAELGCLFAFGETAQEYAVYRVQAIGRQKDLVAQLTLVDDAPAISTADSGAIPAYNSNITIPPDPFTLPPRNLQYSQVINGQGISVSAFVLLTWQVPRFGAIASFEVQQRNDNAGGDWTRVDSVVPPKTSSSVPLAAAGTWSYRVRCIFSDGTASDWVTLDHLALQGLSIPPQPVSNLRNTYINGRSFLSWDQAVDPRAILVEIRKGSTFLSAQIVSDAASVPWQTVGDDTYWVTTYINSPFGVRIYSSPNQSITISGSVALANVIVSYDERAAKWTGTFSGSIGIDQTNNFLRTAGIDNFLGRSSFLGTVNVLDGDGTLQGGGIYWSSHIVNTGGVNFCRVSNNWTATGVPATDDFLGNSDFLGNLDFLKASLSQFVRVRPVIRVSMTGPVPAWGPTQIWSPDVYQGWMFQLGMQFEILTDLVANPGAIAYLLSWLWSIDVPDRLDSYQNLTVPAGAGLPILFQPTGAASAVPFNGGLNDEALPHLTPSIQNPNPGDQVSWSNLSLSGVTLQVMNAGVSVGGSNVNLLVRGY